jgi:hypothetical protein
VYGFGVGMLGEGNIGVYFVVRRKILVVWMGEENYCFLPVDWFSVAWKGRRWANLA